MKIITLKPEKIYLNSFERYFKMFYLCGLSLQKEKQLNEKPYQILDFSLINSLKSQYPFLNILMINYSVENEKMNDFL